RPAPYALRCSSYAPGDSEDGSARRKEPVWPPPVGSQVTREVSEPPAGKTPIQSSGVGDARPRQAISRLSAGWMSGVVVSSSCQSLSSRSSTRVLSRKVEVLRASGTYSGVGLGGTENVRVRLGPSRPRGVWSGRLVWSSQVEIEVASASKSPGAS